MKAMNLNLAQLRRDDLQTRVALNPDTVAEYAEKIKDGIELPPVTVFNVDGEFLLADGFHRCAATAAAGKHEIAAKVIEGTFADALSYALLSNITLTRTNEDKHKALKMAWENRVLLFGTEMPSNVEIARKIGVAHSFVNRHIEEIKADSESTPHLATDNNVADVGDEDDGISENTIRTNLGHGLDRFRQPIPERLIPVFQTKPLRDTTNLVVSAIKSLKSHLELGTPAFAAVSQRALLNLDSAVGELRLSKPYSVCRACAGEGCHYCAEKGFLTRYQYNLLPREYRAK